MPVRPANHVDLERYMGDWFVVENIPYFAERNAYGSIERYKLLGDGKVDTTFLARRGGFDGKKIEARSVAIVTNTENNAEWQVRFLGGILRIPLVILAIDPNYQWAVVSTPDRNLAWIFSRTPVLAQTELDRARAVLDENGIAPERLETVPQLPSGWPLQNQE